MVTKKLSNKFQHIDNPVNDYNGNPLTTSKKQLKRWVEHFVELLNKLTSKHLCTYNQPIQTSHQRQISEEELTHLRIEKQQGLTRYQRKPSKIIRKLLFSSYTTSMKHYEIIKRRHPY